MRALAEFIMRGRLQASVIVLFSVTLPILPLAAIGLVSLRKGPREGALMLMVGMIPALIAGLLGKPVSIVLWGTLLGLLAVYIPAIILRLTVSLATMVQAIVITAIGCGLFTAAFVPELLESFEKMTSLFITLMAGKSPDSELIKPSVVALSGFITMAFALNSLAGLLLARWWQSVLYNPDGFGEEFRTLRLPIGSAVLCAVLVVLFHYYGIDYSFWATIIAIPLVLVALSIVHTVAQQRQLSKTWLAIFYVFVGSSSIVLLVLATIGFADSLLNIRDRFLSKNK